MVYVYAIRCVEFNPLAVFTTRLKYIIIFYLLYVRVISTSFIDHYYDCLYADLKCTRAEISDTLAHYFGGLLDGIRQRADSKSWKRYRLGRVLVCCFQTAIDEIFHCLNVNKKLKILKSLQDITEKLLYFIC